MTITNDAVLTAREKTKLKKLLTGYHNTSFEAGEWNKLWDDEPYDKVSKRCTRAEKALIDYIGHLLGYEAPLSTLLDPPKTEGAQET